MTIMCDMDTGAGLRGVAMPCHGTDCRDCEQEPIIPLDRATLVEHVHQSVMYGQLLYRRLMEVQNATSVDSEERQHYKQLVRHCVGGGLAAVIVAQRVRPPPPLTRHPNPQIAESKQEVKETYAKLDAANVELAARSIDIRTLEQKTISLVRGLALSRLRATACDPTR